jgi:biotin carboxyl carrier protein
MDSLNVASTDQDSFVSTEIPGALVDEEFYASWLSTQCKIIPDTRHGLIVLGPPNLGPYLPVAAWPENPLSGGHLLHAAERAIRERSALLIKRQSRNFSDGPADSYEAAYPIQIGGAVHGALVLEIAPGPREQLEAVLQQLAWGSVWFELRLHRQKAGAEGARTARLQTILDLTASALENDSFEAAATALVTDLAARFSCDRVSLGLVDRDRISLAALSHSLRFSKRVSLTRAIEAAMDEAMDRENLVTYPPPAQAKDSILPAHQQLARRHGASAICSVPLMARGKRAGILIFERLADRVFETSEIEMLDAIGSVLGPVIDLRHRDDQPIGTRLRETVQKQTAVLIGAERIAPKFVAAALVIAIGILAFLKIDYRVAGKTVIEPETLRAAVAPFNGYIAESRVHAGDIVRAGDVLFTVDDRELKLEAAKWQSQKEQYVKQYHVAMAEHNAAQIKIMTAQIAQADAELALVEDQLARTRVRAPIAGVVTKGDLSQSIGAPVERGQVMFESAPLNSYRVILQIDERDIGEVIAGMRGNLVLSAFAGEALPFVIEKVTPVSEAREGRNYFRVEAKTDHASAHLRPGMEGVGKIDVGRRRLIWAWSHRVVDWLRLLAWSWWP